MEQLVNFGSAVKDLGDGRIGGHLVLFSTKADPDLTRQFFTKSTDFEIADGATTPIRYHHGLDPVLKRRVLGIGTMKADEVGVWVETQLALRDKYEAKIYEMVQAGKLGWSSGSAPHLVETKAVGDGVEEILSWPLGLDASLTPTPCEPRTCAVPLKSLPPALSLDELLGPGAPPPSVAKGLFAENLAESDAYQAMDRLQSMLCSTLWELVYQAGEGKIADPTGELDRVLSEFSAAVRAAVAPALAAGGAEKSLPSAGPHGGLRLAAHVEAALAAAQAFDRYARGSLGRIETVTEDRAAKAGRVISTTNLERVGSIRTAAESIVEQCKALEAAGTPAAGAPDWETAKAARALLASFHRTTARLAGVDV